jgi:propanol-preferring alcohol dehydrogenase
MRACLLSAPAAVTQRPLEYTEVDPPSLGPGQIAIDVRACGVCRTDLHVVEGDLKAQRLPLIPGHQIVGTVAALGENVTGHAIGDRVGVAWLRQTCGSCRFCATGRENLCPSARFTGWTDDGGYAERAVAPADFVYPLPSALDDAQVAPLLCAGIIGYRCLRCCRLEDWTDRRLGIYGFGAAGHIAIQIARSRGAQVYVCTRDRKRHQDLAETLGATWVGGATDAPPVKLDAAIVFAPAGPIVPEALKALDKDGRLVLGGIHMSPIPTIDYSDLYWERVIQSVANNTRQDGHEFLLEAARTGVTTHVQTFPLEHANEALIALKHDAVRGAAVLSVE